MKHSMISIRCTLFFIISFVKCAAQCGCAGAAGPRRAHAGSNSTTPAIDRQQQMRQVVIAVSVEPGEVVDALDARVDRVEIGRASWRERVCT